MHKIKAKVFNRIHKNVPEKLGGLYVRQRLESNRHA